MNRIINEGENTPPITQLPGWLFVAAEAGVSSPVDTRLQELPFDQLTWPNFEKLCYRLARSESDVECCRIYGDPGHDQEGIDLFARRAGREKWTVYQCKRVQDFGPAAIEATVREFLKGDLLLRAERFVLCTSESLRAPKRWEAVEKMTAELREHNVVLTVWDALELNSQLKEQPLLVADFFHVAWARSFCPSAHEDGFAQRLSAANVREFRRSCRGFYEQCFGQADAGWLAGGAGGRPLPPLSQRFVTRDVVEQRASRPPVEENTPEPKPTGFDPGATPSDFRHRPQVSRQKAFQSPPEVRTPLGDWLGRGGQLVLAGEPGAGKSTVLRFLALDLLSDAPTLTAAARTWGDHLPVWVPFPLWTRRIAERKGTAVSLLELLREWFQSYSNGYLWPLVERALNDERLLLLVDGLDEWRDEGAARVALQLLHVFIGQRNVPAVLVGRPQGLAAFGPFPPGYRQAALAPLDRTQQQALIERLLEVSDAAAAQADAFFRELDQLPALRATAGVPLLLGLLMRQYLEHARLPVSRFRVGERMLETLLRDHPIRRQQAALVCAQPILAERELREVLALVAWRTHTERPEGLVETATVREWLLTFLADEEAGLGYSRPEARRLADDLLRHGEREFGILVERAPGWSGFFHRTIQELLAAEHLGTLDRPRQLAILGERASQPHWREVLLAWCHRRSAPDFAEIITELERLAETSDVIVQQRVEELLAELATGDFALPTPLARRLTRWLVETIWVCEWPRHRRRLLELTLDGLHGSHPVRSVVQEAVRAWFPGRSGANYGLAEHMAKWPASPGLIEALLHALHHEEEFAQRAAAKSLSAFAMRDTTLANRLAHLAVTSIRASTRACALESFGLSRPEDPRVMELAERERHSGSIEMALTAIVIRIRGGLQTEDDLHVLLRHAGHGRFSVDYHWRPDLIEALLNGWPRSVAVKAAVITSLKAERPWEEEAMDREIAFPVLIRGFVGDEEVALALADFFRQPNAFISLEHNAKEYLPGHARWFAAHPAVAASVEAYLFRDTRTDDYRFAQAALLARTPRVKAHLLDTFRQAKSFGFWCAWALVEGWGAEDEEVVTVLREALYSQPELLAQMAELIPRVLPDQTEARKRLLLCLNSGEFRWPWPLLRGIVAVDGDLSSPDVLEPCLHLAKHAPDWQQETFRHLLIEFSGQDPRIKELALVEFESHDGNLSAVAKGFGHDVDIRARLITMVAPPSAELRAVVVSQLMALPPADPFAREMLSQFDLERDGEVKARAAVAFVRRELMAGTLDPAHVTKLRKMLRAVGFDNEERRQSAVAALLELREFNVIREEYHGRFREGQWLFGESLRQRKETIARQLAKHWAGLEAALSEESFIEFTYHNERLSFASRLAMFVEDAQAARAWVSSLFSTAEHDGVSFELLDFLARTEPSSERLLSLCVGVLHGRIPTPHGWSDQVRTAGLFAAQWGGDAIACVQLTSGIELIQLPDPVLIALALGWPDSDELARYHANAVQEGRKVSWNLWHALSTTFSPPESFARIIIEFAEERGGKEAYVFREAMRAYVARARRDEEVRRALLTALCQSNAPDVKITLAELLAQAAPGWADFREWREREITAVDTTIRGEFGHNLATFNVENLFRLLVEI